MQKLKTPLFFTLAILLALTSVAQQEDNKLWMATEIVINSEQVANYETSLQEIVKLFEENNYPYAWSVFQSTGFTYYYFMEMETLADFDKIIAASNETWKKIDPAILENYVTCIKSYKRFTISSMNEYSYFPENGRLVMEDMQYALWDVHYIKFGTDTEYLEGLKEFMAMAKQHEFGDPVLMIQGGIGTDNPMYAGVLYGKDEIDMRQENKKLWESYGEEGQKMYQKFLPLLRDRETIEFWYRRNLSLIKE